MATIRFRDPIHNFISFEGKEVDLINSPVLQRLRGIKQLALASLVYPGALHTRFDHTLGVTHVAGQMAELLSPHVDSEDRKLVRWAALLHDIGHGPFSHVSENALDRFALPNVLPAEQKKDKIHEVITGHLIKNHPAVRDILGAHDFNLTAEGRAVAEQKAAENPKAWEQIQKAVTNFKKAGDLDYMKMAVAAKTIFMLREKKAAATPVELSESAKALGWNPTAAEISESTKFLESLGLVFMAKA